MKTALTYLYKNGLKLGLAFILIFAFCFTLFNCCITFAQGISQSEIDRLMTDFLSDNYGVSFKVEKELVELGDQVVPALGSILKRDANIWNKLKAANLLGRIATNDAVKILIPYIESNDETILDNIIRIITNLDGSARDVAVKGLTGYLEHEKLWMRSRAQDLLISLGYAQEDIALRLMEIVQNNTGVARTGALGDLARMRDKAWGVIDDLLSFIDSPENITDEFIEFLRVVVTIGDTEDHKVLAILNNLLLSSEFDVRQEAIWGMRWLGLNGEVMMQGPSALLGSDDVSQQLFAVEVISQLALTQPDAAFKLMQIVEDKNYSYDVHQLALNKLGSLVPQLEYHIGRGLLAVKTDDGVFLSWRLLGTEPVTTTFNIYRDGMLVNDAPISNSTNYLDKNGGVDSLYSVCALSNGRELDLSDAMPVWETNYLSIPLSRPSAGVSIVGESYNYIASEVSVGDLTGNGQYDIVLKWDPSNAKDNAQDGFTGNVFIDAYTLEGEMLWRIDLGHNIRAGSHYTQLMVFDLDGDGKAEIVMKTADGTIDGLGNAIGDSDADYRQKTGRVGRVLDGPEYLTVFSGETGAALHTIDYKPARGNVSDWGDSYGNRVDRFLAAIAFLDGQTPSVVMCRGYYTRSVLVAYDFVDGKLVERWTFDSAEPGLQEWGGQGNHQLSVADVDGDGKDEIIYGAMTVDHDGTGLYNTGLGHGDALHVANHDPTRPGLEVFGVHEIGPNDAGVNLRHARTGEIIWGIPTNYDVGRGVAANIDPNNPGSETWAWQTPLMDIAGNPINRTSPPMCFVIWWDGDLQREILEYNKIYKWDWDAKNTVTILSPQGLELAHKPLLQADLFGDWREEVIWRSSDNSELRIFSSTDITEHKIYTLMHDRMYRTAVAWQNVAYNQPPHLSFYIGEDMEFPPYNPGLIRTFLGELP